MRFTSARYGIRVCFIVSLMLMQLQFASYYLQRTYFFDVHPPFGKLLFALMGWFVGYDGHFLFDNIGDSYIDNKVPYVAFRALPALMGS